MDIASLDDLIERLKRHGTGLASVVVIDASGKETNVAVPRLRTKWARLKRLIDELDWRQVRALDKDDKLLEAFESLDADDDDDLVVDELPEEFDVMLRFGEKCVQMVLAGQKTALTPYLKSQQIIMDSQSKLVGTLTDRLVQLESMFGKTLRMAHDAALLATDGDSNSSGDTIGGMLQLAIAVQNAKAAAGAPAAAAAAATPKNGTPK